MSTYALHLKQKGFTLIEVLVAILVLSFGMLGLVGMQVFALQANRDAKLHSDATNLAREMAEMMRGNNQIAIQSSNPYLIDFNPDPDATSTKLTPQNCLSRNSSCTSTEEVAQSQLYEWLDRAAYILPGARILICDDSAPYIKDSQAQTPLEIGRPRWECTPSHSTEKLIVIKIGWLQRNIDLNAPDSNAMIRTYEETAHPQIIVPVTAGNPVPL